VFNGSKDATAKQVQDLLALGSKQRPGVTATQQAQPLSSLSGGAKQNRFLMPISEAEFTITSILEELQKDPNPVKSDKRPLRSTGAALSVAVGLLESCWSQNAGRIMLFTGGPATYGPGLVVSDDLKEPIRSHTDLQKENAKHTKSAMKVQQAHTSNVYEIKLAIFSKTRIAIPLTHSTVECIFILCLPFFF
jgi:protein transport protein SEC23